MTNFIQSSIHSWRSKAILLLFFAFFIGQLYSSAVQSISMILLILISFFDFGKLKGRLFIHFSSTQTQQFIAAYKDPTVWGFTLFFIYLAIPYQQCQDFPYLQERLIIKLPFLLIPAAFKTYSKEIQKYLDPLFIVFILILVAQNIVTYWQQLYAPIATEDILSVGKSIYTPGSHIKFSVIIALVTLTNLYFLTFQHSKSKLLHYTRLFLILLSVFFLHYLSVRTGLLVLYVGFISLAYSYISIRKKYKTGIVMIVTVLLLPIVFYKTYDGFTNKINYMMYDLNKFVEGKGENYSDSGRLASLNVGVTILKENPILGVGYCNIRPKVAESFQQLYPKYNGNLLPHNQFLFTAVGSGLIGLLCLLLGLFFVLSPKGYWSPYMLCMTISMVILFVFDQVIEGTVGVGIVLFYTLIGINFLKNKP